MAARQAGTVRFLSRCSNQVLCMKPQRIAIIDGIAQSVPGERIAFVNGEYETSDEKEIAFIRGHRLYENQIFEDKRSEA